MAGGAYASRLARSSFGLISARVSRIVLVLPCLFELQSAKSRRKDGISAVVGG